MFTFRLATDIAEFHGGSLSESDFPGEISDLILPMRNFLKRQIGLDLPQQRISLSTINLLLSEGKSGLIQRKQCEVSMLDKGGMSG